MVTEIVNPTAGAHKNEYSASTSDAVLSEAAGLLKALGYGAKHVTLIGGIVPGLLVPVLDPEIEPHVGTTDVDVCLSVAIMEGTTGYYRKMQEVLKEVGFAPTEQSWRWRGGTAVTITLEFFCPQPAGHLPGSPFRPEPVRKRSRANLGSKLSAIALETGALIGEDTQEIEQDVHLPGDAGRQRMTLRITGPAGFLAAKALALKDRSKRKDAYDVVWLLDAWENGPEGVAEAVRTSRVWGRQDLAHALEILSDQFRDAGSAGARAYAHFLADAETSPDDVERLAQHAVEAVREFLRFLKTT